MKSHFHLLQINLHFGDYKIALLSLVTAFVVTLVCIPPLIYFINKYRLFDVPNDRKEHVTPIPTMGGLAVFAGMAAAFALWFPFSNNLAQIAFSFSILMLTGLGIMDDLRDLSARYKFIIQTGLAALIATSGIRITSLNGLFGVYELDLSAQYILTILAVVGITNAFNLIDGIDGLAGGLGFMSLITLGLFLTIARDANTALIAFALAGGVLAFLYYNFNPARIFMGDTGSLVLGFVVAVLCIRFMQISNSTPNTLVSYAPVFTLGIVMIPVFDTLRVFGTRIWKGKSPFVADRTHIHHLLTNAGIGHTAATRIICFLHAVILIAVYVMRNVRQEWTLLLLFAIMILAAFIFSNISMVLKWFSSPAGSVTEKTNR
jgi:UDP-N-acetylmuramyl pentapeptide phosphotransferase/UDP-N-acetylglucosamine-1-phosphate transferase